MARFVALTLLAALAGCAPMKPPPDLHVPDFAKKPYAAFSRDAVVAIALREWRLFGQVVNDEPPGTPRPPSPKPERAQGLWQRIGEYWWLGMDAGRDEAGWTGAHDMFGTEFLPEMDGEYAWSAAFISYVMRIAGAGRRFAYAPSHWAYIDQTVREPGGLFAAERPEAAVPGPGDMICTGRGADGALRFDDLPAGPYLSHCDIVVAVTSRELSPGELSPGELSVVGGNVDDGVTMKHVPTTSEGRLATEDGKVVDPRYPWMVVLRARD